jgi:hypothetical protein
MFTSLNLIVLAHFKLLVCGGRPVFDCRDVCRVITYFKLIKIILKYILNT